MMQEKFLEILVLILESFSILIIIWGAVLQFFYFIKSEFTSKSIKIAVEKVTILKNYLGTYILFALEVLIGADIIESILNPSPDHIISLAAIVIIRTIISYFLNKEIESAYQNENQQGNDSNDKDLKEIK